jgi:integrase
MARPRKSNRHLPKYVYEHHGAWWFRPPNGGPSRICEVGDYRALYAFMADKLDPVRNDELTTLHACFQRYEREVLPTLADLTQKSYRIALRVLDETFGDRHPDDLQPRDIGRFLDVSTGRVHRNRQVAVLSAVYTKAVGRWYVAERNPCIGVERNQTRKRDRYVTDAEFAIVYQAMPPRVRIAMDLALLTGQRQGDLLGLTWDQVTPEGIAFRQGKTGKRLLVGMSPALEEVLDRAKQMVPQLPRLYVIKTAKGRAYSGEGFRAIWQRRMRRLAEGHWKRAKGKTPVWVAPKLPQRFTFHDLRAKSVSDSETLNEAFERAGHTSMAMTRGVYDRGVRKVKPLR